jgi:hypothetical protein
MSYPHIRILSIKIIYEPGEPISRNLTCVAHPAGATILPSHTHCVPYNFSKSGFHYPVSGNKSPDTDSNKD